MRCLVQRVASASVEVDSSVVGSIGHGLLVLVCAMQADSDDDAIKAAGKIARLRIFRDGQGKMNRSLVDVGGAILAVSQFTLAADTRRGNRPGFSQAASPEVGLRLFNRFLDEARKYCEQVETGSYGSEMLVRLENDGPVTIWLDTS